MSRRLVSRPGLLDMLSAAGRVVNVSAPAGSGKTFLLRSWIAAERIAERTAWVSVAREEHDPVAFWFSVVDAIRGTRAGSDQVRELTAAPDLDSATVVNRLREDLTALREPLWVVFDDLHELVAEEAIGALELLVRTAPVQVRLVLVSRRDLRLGLHRLRLEGELTEIRGEDLRFSPDESRALLEAAGVRLSDTALESVVAATEGWAAGLRLVALSLEGHPEPERYAAGFSGRERAVAEYLLAEVLERQPQDVTRLLLRTSLLERVSGPLADRLTGCPGGEGILAELEDQGAFVVALDPQRTWFRYHRLFADLLALELRRTAPDELPRLHTIAAEWFAEHGNPVQAIRHAQAAENWGLAARLLFDNWFVMYLDGRTATGRELLAAFPAAVVTADAELTALAGVNCREAGFLGESERYLTAAAGMSESVAPERRPRFEVLLAIGRLELGRARNDPEAIAEEAQRLSAAAAAPESIELGLGEELRTLAMIELGIAQISTWQLDAAEAQLEKGVAEARRVGRPLLELDALSHCAVARMFHYDAAAEQRAREATELAEKHGWEDTRLAATAYVVLGATLLRRGWMDEAEPWLDRAERVLRDHSEPTATQMLYANRLLLAFARGHRQEALNALRAAEQIEQQLVVSRLPGPQSHAFLLMMQTQLGETEKVERAIAEMDAELRDTAGIRLTLAGMRLAQGDPEGIVDALTPILDGSIPLGPNLASTTLVGNPGWEIDVLLLEAIARDALSDRAAASRALERALELAESHGVVLPFLMLPVRELLERHPRSGTSHASLVSELRLLLSGRRPTPRRGEVEPLTDPLSDSELRVLRYLPTNLTAPEIAAELFVSLNTIRTHMRNAYAKLGAHSRAEAVARARELGLLSPSSRTR